jgi:hypothetical protein
MSGLQNFLEFPDIDRVVFHGCLMRAVGRVFGTRFGRARYVVMEMGQTFPQRRFGVEESGKTGSLRAAAVKRLKLRCSTCSQDTAESVILLHKSGVFPHGTSIFRDDALETREGPLVNYKMPGGTLA